MTTVSEQMAAAMQYRILWESLFPHLQAPDTDQFLLWAGRYQSEIVFRGINRASSKARKMKDTSTPMSTYDAVKYASSVMKNESLGIRRHSQQAHQQEVAA